MFKRNDMPKYQDILFKDTLKDRILSKINETEAGLLNNLIEEQLRNGKLDQAILYAEKMAIYHGVPGLIHYINLHIKSIESQVAEGEMVQQLGLNTLGYLHMTELLYQIDPSANQLMSQLIPEENINSPSYWHDKKEALINLASLEGLEDEGEKMGRDMFEPLELHKQSFVSVSKQK